MLENNISLDFFMSQIKVIKEVKDSDKTRINIVLYEPTQSTCVLRVCKGRDLTSVCEALRTVKNPNVAYVYDYVYANGDTYIIEEKLSGETVETRLSEINVFSEEQTSKIITAVCDGLSELHKLNPPLIHNDINPSNIMICDDSSIKLFDFDVSRTYKKGSVQNTVLFGTEEYASPEHFGYGQSEPRSDIYCLGVTMHKMLTGQYLSSEHKSLYKGRLNRIVEKCIEIDPEKRYASVEHLKKDIERLTRHGAWVWKAVAVITAVVLLCLSGFILKQCGDGPSDAAVFNESEVLSQNTSSTTHDSSQSTPSDQIKDESVRSDTSSTASLTQSSDGEASSDVGNTSSAVSSGNSVSQDISSENKTPDNMVEDKKVVSKRVNGEIRSMTVLNDGTLVYLENDSNGYHIKTFAGADTTVTVPFSQDRCVLIYDNYRDKLYIVATSGEKSSIYAVDKSFQIKPQPLYTATRSTVIDIKGSFYSDGTLYCDAFQKELIDTDQWCAVGKAGASGYMVANDELYCVWSVYLYKVKFDGGVISDYAWPKGCSLYSSDAVFSNNKCLYFNFTKDRKDYIYTFDGKEFKELICLNDYKFYTDISCEVAAISGDTLWMYDQSTATLKEFSIK